MKKKQNVKSPPVPIFFGNDSNDSKESDARISDEIGSGGCGDKG